MGCIARYVTARRLILYTVTTTSLALVVQEEENFLQGSYGPPLVALLVLHVWSLGLVTCCLLDFALLVVSGAKHTLNTDSACAVHRCNLPWNRLVVGLLPASALAASRRHAWTAQTVPPRWPRALARSRHRPDHLKPSLPCCWEARGDCAHTVKFIT